MNKPTYEELDAQLHAVVAENVALKELKPIRVDWICNTCATIYHTMNDDVAQGYIDEIRATLEREILLTPATDAAIAALRAEGVEMLADMAGSECNRYKAINDRAGLRKWKSIVILCCDFAAQLRQSVQVKGVQS